MASTSNRIKGITIEIGGNTTKLQDSLKKVNSSLKNTQSALKDVDSLLKFDPSNTTLLQQKQEYLAKAVEETTQKLKQEKEALNQLSKSANSKDTQEQQKALQREIASTESYLNSLTNRQKEFGSVSKQQILAASEKMKEFGSKITAVGKELTKLSAVLVGIGAASISAFKEVDKGMDAIIKKTGATGEALEDMQKSLKTITKSMAVDFDETGNALGEINTRFGLTGSALEELTKKFLQFSKITGNDVVDSVDTVQNALAAFNMDVSDASKLLDVLTKVSQKTGASTSVIASALVENATALQEMGLDIYQAANFMGQLETAGADSVSVISGLKRALKSATDDGKDFSTALSDLQSSIVNSNGSMSALEKTYELFGKSGAAVFTAVKNGQIDFTNLASSSDILNESLGATNETYDATLDFTDKWKIMTNALQIALSDLGEELGEVLIPIIEKLIEAIEAVTQWFSGLSDTQKTMVVVIGLVVAAIGPLIVALGTLTTSLSALNIVIVGTPVGWILAAVAAIILVIVDLVNIIKHLYENCTEFRDMCDGVCMDIQYYFDVMCEKIRNSIYEDVESFAYFVNHIKDIPDIVENVSNAIQGHVSEKFGQMKDDVVSSVDTMVNKVKQGWESALDTTRDKLIDLYYETSTNFSNIRNNIYDNCHLILERWRDLWDMVKDSFIWRIASILNVIWEYFEAIVDTIKKIVKHIKEVWDEFWENLREQRDKAAEWGADLVENMKNGIEESVPKMEKSLKKLAQTIKDYLGFSEPKTGPLSNFHTYMPDMIDLMTEGIDANIPRLEKASDKMAAALIPNTNTDLQYDLNATTTASVDNLTSLFNDYLPQLAAAQNVNVVLQGDAKGVFKLVRQENSRMVKSTGYHALA